MAIRWWQIEDYRLSCGYQCQQVSWLDAGFSLRISAVRMSLWIFIVRTILSELTVWKLLVRTILGEHLVWKPYCKRLQWGNHTGNIPSIKTVTGRSSSEKTYFERSKWGTILPTLVVWKLVTSAGASEKTILWIFIVWNHTADILSIKTGHRRKSSE